jgi:copper homeostasis protein
MMKLEICVDSVESAVAAEIGGAQRVELCSALAEGGLTPSLGLIRAVRSRIGIGVHVMIRPRGGDFFYSDEELAVMRDDIRYAAQIGADGVVLGLLTADGEVDVEGTRELVNLARHARPAQPMQVTFHRAIDMARDMEAALEDVVQTGADRILTSGAAQSAIHGTDCVASLVRTAGSRIGVMVCGGVRPENVQQIAHATGADQFHAALRTSVPSPVTNRKEGLYMGNLSLDEYARHKILASDVRSLRQAIDALSLDGVSKGS